MKEAEITPVATTEASPAPHVEQHRRAAMLHMQVGVVMGTGEAQEGYWGVSGQTGRAQAQVEHGTTGGTAGSRRGHEGEHKGGHRGYKKGHPDAVWEFVPVPVDGFLKLAMRGAVDGDQLMKLAMRGTMAGPLSDSILAMRGTMGHGRHPNRDRECEG